MRYLRLICAERMIEQIRRSGHFVDGNRLLPLTAGATVRVRDGRISTTDGPFVETKERLGGYYVIAAANPGDAPQSAAEIPGARLGCVEVRPIADDAPTLRALGVEPTPRGRGHIRRSER